VNSQKRIYVIKEYLDNTGRQNAKLQIREGRKFVEEQQHNQVLKPQRHRVRAILVERSEVVGKRKEMCWMVHKKKDFDQLLLGDKSAYVINDFINPIDTSP